MKTHFHLLAGVLGMCLLVTCSTTAPPAKSRFQQLLALKHNFPQKDLNTVTIPSLQWEEYAAKYKTLDSNARHLVFADNNKKHIADKVYYYSWVGDDSSYIKFADLEQDEDGGCTTINYFVFGKDGHLVGSFPMAATCGDAEWAFSSWGKFISKDTYQYTSVETNGEYNSATKETIENGDSIVTRYIINPTGKVTTTIVSNTRVTHKTVATK